MGNFNKLGPKTLQIDVEDSADLELETLDGLQIFAHLDFTWILRKFRFYILLT